jgi:hypothetical protein
VETILRGNFVAQNFKNTVNSMKWFQDSSQDKKNLLMEERNNKDLSGNK